MTKKIAVANNKGGTLKTTTSTSIASILSQNPENKVLLVDSDAQGNASVTFGKNPLKFKNTIYDVLIDGLPIEETVVQLKENLMLLPSNSDMDYLDQDVWTNQKRYPKPFKLLKKSLEGKIETNFTHIVFDASPSMNLMNMNILSYVDSIIVPFELEETALKGIVKMVEKVNESKEKTNTSLEIGALLPVKVESRTNLHQQILDEVKEYAQSHDIYLFEKGIPKTIKHAESVTQEGLPAVETSKSNKAVEHYYTFVNSLIERNIL